MQSELVFDVGGKKVVKSISREGQDRDIQAGPLTVSRQRFGPGGPVWTGEGAESMIPEDTGVQLIDLAHEVNTTDPLGLPLPWWLSWMLLATVAALALRGPMGVKV